jgi:dihydroxyacetone kinase
MRALSASACSMPLARSVFHVAPDQMIEAAEAVDTGAGVLFIVKNYEGDVMNFTMAADGQPRGCSVVTNRQTWRLRSRPTRLVVAASRGR